MKRKYEKRDSVSFILLISKIQILAASYYNGLIVLWDTLLMEQRKVYRDHKTVRKKLQIKTNKKILIGNIPSCLRHPKKFIILLRIRP